MMIEIPLFALFVVYLIHWIGQSASRHDDEILPNIPWPAPLRKKLMKSGKKLLLVRAGLVHCGRCFWRPLIFRFLWHDRWLWWIRRFPWFCFRWQCWSCFRCRFRLLFRFFLPGLFPEWFHVLSPFKKQRDASHFQPAPLPMNYSSGPSYSAYFSANSSSSMVIYMVLR